VRAVHDLEILPNAEANANGQFLHNFADPEPWMRRQNQEAAALARQRVQFEGAQNGAGNLGPGGMNDEHALLRERQQEIIDRVNEQHASVRDRQREIVTETERRIQRRAERERLMREDEDGEGVIERAMAGIRERGNIPDAGLREVEEELRGMDGLWQCVDGVKVFRCRDTIFLAHGNSAFHERFCFVRACSETVWLIDQQ